MLWDFSLYVVAFLFAREPRCAEGSFPTTTRIAYERPDSEVLVINSVGEPG